MRRLLGTTAFTANQTRWRSSLDRVVRSTAASNPIDTARRSKSTVPASNATTTTADSMRVPVPRPPITAHSSGPPKTVPSQIVAPFYADTGEVGPPPNEILLHDEASIQKLRQSGRLAATVLKEAMELARLNVGLTTDEIDDFVHERIVSENAYPSPLNYSGFPKSVCSSVNEVVCHGIPDSRPLQFGDVISLDVSCYVDHYHGDNCGTVIVGDYDETNPRLPRTDFGTQQCQSHFASARRLVRATQECLEHAIAAVRPGGCLSEIGGACQEVVDAYGYSSVAEYRGHGIGRDFHTPPFVQHFRNSYQLELKPGMIFTIEPMICEQSNAVFEWASDQWTVATVDRGLAAQFEHMVLVTDTGVEVLTIPDGSDEEPLTSEKSVPPSTTTQSTS